jgi:hypothetical protein
MIIVQPFWNQGLKCASRALWPTTEHPVTKIDVNNDKINFTLNPLITFHYKVVLNSKPLRYIQGCKHDLLSKYS